MTGITRTDQDGAVDAGDNWAAYALCATKPVDLFVRGAAQNKAKSVCTACPVRAQCLAEALDNRIEWGGWGGMTERGRRALLRTRPHISYRHQVRVQARRGPDVAQACVS